uniref:IQ domain-containing protein C isoform X2 n=1 Tax=Doryrhamphus excisus TaxID=161450 RepID=UPI0025ADA575|nr:IQ domain-containing protein C isoform X2 [Doryrhamphus excisus]
MDRRNLAKTLCLFQAYVRGYLVREEVRRARTDFEDVVKEIDGTLAHLKWKGAIISTPHFTDTDGPLHGTTKDPGPDVRATSQNPAATEGGMHCVLLQTEAERDGSGNDQQTRECLESSSFPAAGQKLSCDDVLESTRDSTSIWSSMELESQLPHKGLQRYCSAQEVPHNPEALRFHRDALTMELLWLQQAIDSRKKYLSLKDKLSMA